MFFNGVSIFFILRFLNSSINIDPLLSDPHGSRPGSDNLKGRLMRAPIQLCKIW
jgi:hypothetical protein